MLSFSPWVKIFLSYRRDDSAEGTRALYSELVENFGKHHVFFDVKDIDGGDKFAAILDKRIASCDVVVVVIGPQWLTIKDGDGQVRIQAAGDYVRHEVATALRSKRVIAVTIDGAALPTKAQLPDDIAALVDGNVLDLGKRELGVGADRLIDAIRRVSGTGGMTKIYWRRVLTFLGFASAAMMFFAAWIGAFDYFDLDTYTATATMWLADVAAPVAASDAVQMVVIDRTTEGVLHQKFTHNPAARRDHADLIRRLARAGARTIAFDLFVTTPSPADDAVLVEAIGAARKLKAEVIFGAQDIDADGPVMLPALRSAISRVAMLCYGKRLGYASTVPLATQRAASAGAEQPQAQTIGLALAAAWPGTARIDMRDREVQIAGIDGGPPHDVPFSQYEPIVDGKHCKIGRVDDTVATALYRAAPLAALNRPERRIAFEQVLAMDAAALRQRFAGKAVLVGLALPGEDEAEVFHGLSSETRHGLELHADAAGALLDRRIVQPFGRGAQFVAMAALGLFGSRLSEWLAPPLPGWLRAVVLVGIAAACAALAVALCASSNRLANLTYPIGALAVGYGLAKFAERRR